MLPFASSGSVQGAEATVQAALRTHIQSFRAHHTLTPRQGRVLWRLTSCRTEALGGYRYVCEDCGTNVHLYQSCNDANCTVCSGGKRRRWAEHKAALLLPVPHFQVVFTLPDDLWPIAALHKK